MYKIWEDMESLVEIGYVKHIGIGNANCQLLLDMLTYGNIKPAVNQIEIHPYCPQSELIKFGIDNDIQVMGYCPLTAPVKVYSQYRPPNILEEELIIELAGKYKIEPAQIALAWGLSKTITSIPKTSNLERAKQNIDSVNIILDQKDIDKINKLETGQKIVDPEGYEIEYTPLFK